MAAGAADNDRDRPLRLRARCGCTAPALPAAGGIGRRGLLFGAPALAALWAARPAGAAEPPLPWRALMAPGWAPASYFRSLPAAEVGALDDDDPRARALLAQLHALARRAPPDRSLDGRAVRLVGFAQKLAGAPGRVERCRFVPYLGGCIHRPPPPANQAVVVDLAEAVPESMLPYRLWLAGRLEVAATDTALGASAYRMRAGRLSAFDENADRAFALPYLVL